jgi:hypothetical protein
MKRGTASTAAAGGLALLYDIQSSRPAHVTKLGLAMAENEHDRGDCTPSSARSSTSGCCARVAERRAEHLGLPMYIYGQGPVRQLHQGGEKNASAMVRLGCALGCWLRQERIKLGSGLAAVQRTYCYLREARGLADQGKATQRRRTPLAEQSPARARHEETGRPTLMHSS